MIPCSFTVTEMSICWHKNLAVGMHLYTPKYIHG